MNATNSQQRCSYSGLWTVVCCSPSCPAFCYRCSHSYWATAVLFLERQSGQVTGVRRVSCFSTRSPVANSTLLKPSNVSPGCFHRFSSLVCVEGQPALQTPGLSALSSPSATAEEVNLFTGETSFQNPSSQHHLAVFYKLTGRKTQTQPENITSML